MGFVLTIGCLIDAGRRPAHEYAAVDQKKGTWMVIQWLTFVAGAGIYLLWMRPKLMEAGASGNSSEFLK